MGSRMIDALQLGTTQLARRAAAAVVAVASTPAVVLGGLITLASNTPAGEPPKEEDGKKPKEPGPDPTQPDIGPPSTVGAPNNEREERSNAPILADDFVQRMEERVLDAPRRRGISGAHNRQAFDQALAQERGTIRPVRQHPTSDGIEQVTYSLQVLDKTGAPTNCNSDKTYDKTTYDPGKISAAQITHWTEEAAKDAARNNGGTLAREWEGTTKDGVAMRGYADNGTIISAFPCF